MTRRKPQSISNQEALEDQLLLGLFHNRRATGKDMKRLADYTGENEWRVLAYLAQRGDIVFVGDGQVIITLQGLRRVIDSHPELQAEGIVKDKEP
jgi:hypothetical protein